MFVAIYLRYPFRYFYLLYPTFRHVHPVGVGADLSCPCPRNSPKWRCIFALLALQFISFRHIKTIWFGLKNGRDESAPTPYGMFAAIHLRKKWILRNVRCHTFALPISLFLFIIIHVLPRSPRRRRGRFIVPVPTKFHKMVLRIPTVDIAIHHTAPTKHPQNGVALVLFGNIIFTYFWVLPTFLYLTNFAFAK